jgi:RNA repair pathway DNA polymerase beta family
MSGTRPGTGRAGWPTRSGAGDLDVIIYSARKWARLALAGNPTVPLVLFVPDSNVVFRDQAGAELAANAHRFVSRLAAGRYLGYLQAQKAAMTRQAGARTNRPELVAVHGYDAKYAMHALRLALQRHRAAHHRPHHATRARSAARERPLAEVLDAVSGAEARLAQLRDSPAIADRDHHFAEISGDEAGRSPPAGPPVTGLRTPPGCPWSPRSIRHKTGHTADGRGESEIARGSGRVAGGVSADGSGVIVPRPVCSWASGTGARTHTSAVGSLPTPGIRQSGGDRGGHLQAAGHLGPGKPDLPRH